MQQRSIIEPRFFATYYYADVVTTVLEDRYESASEWEAFLCDDQVVGMLSPYGRTSVFHGFLWCLIDRLNYEHTVELELDERKKIARFFRGVPDAARDLAPETLPIEQAFLRHQVDFESFVQWLKARKRTFAACNEDDVYDYFTELRDYQPYHDLMSRLVQEVFYVLFGNRELLLRFNLVIAEEVQRLGDPRKPGVGFFLTDEERQATASLFERAGVLKRAYMPEWVRRAVFFRDRGRCVGCLTDLTGLVTLWSEENFDHMVSLAAGGLNDVTNIQLLCGRCNRKKADGKAFTSRKYEDWYSMAETSSVISGRVG